MKRALLAALLLVACKRPAAAPPRAETTRDMTLPAGWSRGFGAGQPTAPQPGEIKKKVDAPSDDNDDDDEPKAVLPPELASRPAPASGLALYVDGALKRTLLPRELAAPVRLDSVVKGSVRAALVHGDGANLWIGGRDLSGYQIRINRRGKIKLEPLAGAAGSAHGSQQGGRDEMPAHSGKQGEVRGVHWIEARTPKSPRLAGEPTK